MQRLFSMFPPGSPGLALLLLRASVTIALFLDIHAHYQRLSGWMLGAAIILSVALCAGYLTPIAAVLAFLFQVLLGTSAGVASAGPGVLFCLDALALALIGPGAYSVDAYRFGRRVVVLPPP